MHCAGDEHAEAPFCPTLEALISHTTQEATLSMLSTSRFPGRPYAVIFSIALLLSVSAQAEPRTWNNNSGQSIEAEIQSATDKEVVLQMANGTNYPVSIASLSEADQKFITE